MSVPNPSPVLDKIRAPSMGQETLSSAGAGVWRKAPEAFPDSSSVLDQFQSATNTSAEVLRHKWEPYRDINGRCMYHFPPRESENDKRPESRGFKKLSEFGNSSGMKAPKTLVLLCFDAIREGWMIRDRSLLTS